jgi:hypothetical protein
VTQEWAVEFDRWNRYMLMPEAGGAPVPHTRVTTFANTLDDRFGLHVWEQRMTALGLARRPDLLARVAATPETDKHALDLLVAQAREAAEATSGANMGTATHQFTERHDRGELLLERIPEPWHADIAAYAAMLQEHKVQIEQAFIERIVVLPEWQVAGRFDRFVIHQGKRRVFDVKSAKVLKLIPVAIQLALYGHAATLYDEATGTHSPMPEVDRTVGLVAHMPAGSGKCELLAVDIALGWQYALLAQEVRLARVAWSALALPLYDAVAERRAWLVGAVQRLVREYPPAAERLAELWPQDVPTLKHDGHTAEQLAAIATEVHKVEGLFGIPFGELDPGFATETNIQTEADTERRVAS